MDNKENIMKDLKGIFTKSQQSQVKIEYSNDCGGEIRLTASEPVFRILDNENSKLFNKFKDVVINKYDLGYDFSSCTSIVIYEE